MNSAGSYHTTVRQAALALGVAALLPALAWAAVPDSRAPNGKTDTQTTARPTSQPSPSASRGPGSLTRQTPLGEAIEILRNSTTPPLNIIVLWKPLEDAGIRRDTPIGIDGVAGLRVGRYLDLLTLSLSAGASARIGYVVEGGVITISTVRSLPVRKPVVQLYYIADLAAPPARYSLPTMGPGMPYGGLRGPFGGYGGGMGAGSFPPLSGTYQNPAPITRVYPNR